MKKMLYKIASCLLLKLSEFLYNLQWAEKLSIKFFIRGLNLHMKHRQLDTTPCIKTNQEWMYEWLLHYNSYTNTWHAFHREDHAAYWNRGEMKHPLIEAKCVTSLLEKLKNTCDALNSDHP